jgi:hypothetical protein
MQQAPQPLRQSMLASVLGIAGEVGAKLGVNGIGFRTLSMPDLEGFGSLLDEHAKSINGRSGSNAARPGEKSE